MENKGIASLPRLSWLQNTWLVALYLAGALMWGQFFNWGKVPFNYLDWAEISGARLSYLRQAVIQDVLPLHASETAHLRNLTDRIQAIPDFIIVPQSILLRWMDVGMFIVVNTLLLYTLSFLGLLWFKREYHINPVIFSILVLLFNFNGHLISHLSVGHITWWGNFIFPLFFIQVFRVLRGDRSWLWVTETSLLLFFMFLLGGYHQYTWCLIFLGLLGVVTWKNLASILKVMIFANLLTMVRLLPPALLLGKFDTGSLGGYPLIRYVLLALLIERLPANTLPFQNFYSELGYWEFDLYVGIAGIAFLGFGFLLWIYQSYQSKRFPSFLVPMSILALFSIRNYYQFFAWFPIPLLSAERVTSRMMILPFSLGMIIAAIAIQSWLDRRQRRWIWHLGSLITLGYLAIDLGRQTLNWSVVNAAKSFPETPVNLTIKTLANHPDLPYTNTLLLGAIISLATLIFLFAISWREVRNHKHEI